MRALLFASLAPLLLAAPLLAVPVQDASPSQKGVLALRNDLAGTADNPRVVGAHLPAGAITDAMLANAYSGVGACPAHQWADVLTRNAAPTCAAIVNGDLPGSGAVTINTSAPLAGGGGLALGGSLTLSIPVATSLAGGYLAALDWQAFNGKAAVGSCTNQAITADTSGGVTCSTLTGAYFGSSIAAGTIFGNNTAAAGTAGFQNTILLRGTAPQVELGVPSSVDGNLKLDLAGGAGSATIAPGASGASALTWTLPTATPGASGALMTVSSAGALGTLASAAAGAVMISASSGSAPKFTAAGTADQVFRQPSVAGDGAWGAVDLTKSAAVTGALGVGNGGTGQSSNWNAGGLVYASSATVLASTAAPVGSLAVYNDTGAPGHVDDVAAGSLLTSGGTSTNPAYLAVQACQTTVGTPGSCTATVRSGCRPFGCVYQNTSTVKAVSCGVSGTTFTCVITGGANGDICNFMCP